MDNWGGNRYFNYKHSGILTSAERRQFPCSEEIINYLYSTC